MSQSIPAIFDSGVFKPLVPVDLEPGTRVEIGIPSDASTPQYSAESMRNFLERLESMPDDSLGSGASSPVHDVASWRDFVADMEAMPDDGIQDGLSNRDHDKILYGN